MIGTCFGKFTKSGKFRLQIFCLDYLAKYAKYKIWLKASGEQTFLYGNHIAKSHVARITENTPVNTGVVVLSTTDIPLGFGVTAKSTVDVRIQKSQFSHFQKYTQSNLSLVSCYIV